MTQYRADGGEASGKKAKLSRKERIAEKKQQRRAAKQRRGSDDEDFEPDLQDPRFAVRSRWLATFVHFPAICSAVALCACLMSSVRSRSVVQCAISGISFGTLRMFSLTLAQRGKHICHHVTGTSSCAEDHRALSVAFVFERAQHDGQQLLKNGRWPWVIALCRFCLH